MIFGRCLNGGLIKGSTNSLGQPKNTIADMNINKIHNLNVIYNQNNYTYNMFPTNPIKKPQPPNKRKL